MTLADVEFNITEPLSEQEDILRCLRTLIMTPAGTVPLDRDFGIDNSCLSYPLEVAKNIFAVELIDKAKTYEPRADISAVDFDYDDDGNITAKVVLSNG
jgi:hypothetical protein